MTKKYRHKTGELVLSHDLKNKTSTLGTIVGRDENGWTIRWMKDDILEDFYGYSDEAIEIYKIAFKNYKKNFAKKPKKG